MRYFSELTNKSLDNQIYVVGSRVQTVAEFPPCLSYLLKILGIEPLICLIIEISYFLHDCVTLFRFS